MPRLVSISMQSIAFLRLMDNHHAEALGAVFVSEVYCAGDVIVPQGRPWGYVRVVAEGDVEVRSVGGTATTIKFGGSIGEVSILEPNSIAQATVRAGSDGAVMLRASRAEIIDYLATFPECAEAFYRGLATALAGLLLESDAKVVKLSAELSRSLLRDESGPIVKRLRRVI